jgi:hypothetical protein
VVDPVLVYSTYLGGTPVGVDGGFDGASAVALGADGSVYVAGGTSSPAFATAIPTRIGPPFDPSQGDAFVAKIDSGATAVQWLTIVGGSSWEGASGLAVDASGRVTVAGTTASSDFPTAPAGAYDSTLGGGQDAFVFRLQPDGSALEFATYLGGGGDEWGSGVALDEHDGSAVAVGTTTSADFPVLSPLSGQGSLHGALTTDGFVTWFQPSGAALANSSYLGGVREDTALAITAGPSGLRSTFYVVGGTTSPDFPTTPLVANPTWGLTSDGFVSQIGRMFPGTNLRFVYSTFVNGAGWDYVSAVARASDGGVHLAVTKEPPESGHWHGHAIGLSDRGRAFTYDFDFGEGGRLLAIAENADGAISVVGFADHEIAGNPSFPYVTPLLVQSGGEAAYVAKLNPGGTTLRYATDLGCASLSGSTDGAGVAAAGNDTIVVGTTYCSDFMVKNALQPAYADGGDAFLTRIGDGTCTGTPGGCDPLDPGIEHPQARSRPPR